MLSRHRNKTDITEIPCKDGKLYLAAILDCYDGTIRGFKMADNMQADLCVEAFQRACRDDGAYGMVLHSDYTEENTMPKNFGNHYAC